MKAFLSAFVFLSMNLVHAAPNVTAQQFDCQNKFVGSNVWTPTGQATAFMGSDGLHLDFSNSGMSKIQTTNTEKEHMLEAKCPGSITLSDSKPFKIRSFTWNVGFANIEGGKGKIQLFVKGETSGNGKVDGFDKPWKVDKRLLDSYNNETDSAKKASMNPFNTQVESVTICGNQLSLRFEDLRGVAERESSKFEETLIELNELIIAIDPC